VQIPDHLVKNGLNYAFFSALYQLMKFGLLISLNNIKCSQENLDKFHQLVARDCNKFRGKKGM